MMGRLDHDQEELFYSFRLDEAVPDDHPVRCQKRTHAPQQMRSAECRVANRGEHPWRVLVVASKLRA